MNETLNLNEETILKLINFYKENEVKSNNQYIRFMAKCDNCTISVYLSNKVVFQGNNAKYESSIWNDNQITDNVNSHTSSTLPQCGSDEVGTGDYFGPVCVCASYIDEEIANKISKYNITDSKALNDDYILKIGKEISEIVPHSLLILPNEKYNEIHKTTNMNAIKAILHNSCYNHLSKKVKMPNLNVIDQFAEEPIYYHYLKHEKEVFRNLHFETKAESKYIAVAASSIIARYSFIKSLDKLNEMYNTNFPKGAGNNVDEFIKEFIELHGFDELNKVAKTHFKNTEKAMNK